VTHTNSEPQPHLSAVTDRRDDAQLERAIVAWFCSDRGFGQVRTADGELVYVNQREILREGFRALEADQHVTWIRGHDQHGTVAREVTVVAAQVDTAIAS